MPFSALGDHGKDHNVFGYIVISNYNALGYITCSFHLIVMFVALELRTPQSSPVLFMMPGPV